MPDELAPRSYRGRFAPSPTGELHLGSAVTALVAWLSARSQGGQWVLRIEDIDTPRVVPGIEEHEEEDLHWLGLDWDEGPDIGGPFGPYRQSERSALYDAAIRELDRLGLIYYCDCSRAEIARIASAPHPGDEGPIYPGTCRPHGMRSRSFKRPPSIRLRVEEGATRTIVDALQGEFSQDISQAVGDFVLRRGDGVYAYQLAVVVDDLAMGITEVVRGVDLLGSAPRQALLAELLGGEPPRFAHVPLVVSASGERLAKRAHGVALRDYREAGLRPTQVLAKIAHDLGFIGDDVSAITKEELLERFDRGKLAGKRQLRIYSLGALS